VSTLAWLSLCAGLAAALFAWGALGLLVPAFARTRRRFSRRADINLTELFLFVDTTVLFYAYVAVLIVIPALMWLAADNPVAPIATFVILLVLPRKIYQKLRERRLRRFQEQMPDALRTLASSLEAGSGLGPALEGLVQETRPPLSQEFSLVLREQRLGVDLDEAFQHVAVRLDIDDFYLFVAALRIARDVGGNLAQSLQQVGETLRRRLTTEGKVRALTAQGRLQSFVMASIPVLVGGFLVWRYPVFRHALLHSHLGWGVIAFDVVMEYLGFRLCRKIATVDV
jgi:tight adherence protein B